MRGVVGVAAASLRKKLDSSGVTKMDQSFVKGPIYPAFIALLLRMMYSALMIRSDALLYPSSQCISFSPRRAVSLP